MTAIAVAVGRDGIALAADGKGWECLDGSIIRDDVQKIFPFGTAGAFAVTGWAVAPQFSIPEAAARAAEQADSKDFHAAMIGFALEVNRQLALARHDGRFPPFPEHEDQADFVKRNTVARILVLVPSDNGARLAVVRFHHRSQLLQDPIIEERAWRPGALYLTGSDRVAAWMCGQHGERKPLNGESSLEDAIRIVDWYVRTCASPAGRSLDPWCSHVGGRIHIAMLTGGEFRWRRRPAAAA